MKQPLQNPSSKAKRLSTSAYSRDSKATAYFDVEFESERRGTNWDGEEKNKEVKRDESEARDAVYFDIGFEAEVEGKRDVNGLGTPGDRRREGIQVPGLQDDPHGEFDGGER